VEKAPNVRRLYIEVPIHIELTRLWTGYFGLGQLVAKEQPDVVWCQNFGPYRRVNAPVVITMNNPHQIYPLEATRSHPQNCVYVWLLRYFFQKSLKVCDGLMTQTHLMATYLRQAPGAPQKIKVIAKAVEDDQDVKALPLGDAIRSKLHEGNLKDAFTWLYVSSDYPHKNYKILPPVFSLLKKEGIHARVAVSLTREQLLEVAKGYEDVVESGHMVPLGWVDKSQLRALYDACQGCLMPSILEALSSTHLEAMAWGKPLISSNMPFATDLCGDASLYAEPHDPDGWAAKIKLVMSDETVRKTLVENGFTRISLFPKSWTDVARQTRDFLHEVSR
jgi:glycosyltransferase involved in cell wall biosynthesis